MDRLFYRICRKADLIDQLVQKSINSIRLEDYIEKNTFIYLYIIYINTYKNYAITKVKQIIAQQKHFNYKF